MSLLMIGCGKMGSSLLTRSANSTDHKISIINPTIVNAASYVIVTHAFAALPEQCFDIIVITGKSQLTTQVLLGNRPHLTNLIGMMVIAVIFSVSSIEKLMAKQANMRIMRSAQIAQGISVFFTKPCYNPSPINSAIALTYTDSYRQQTDSEDERTRVAAIMSCSHGYAGKTALWSIESAINFRLATQVAKVWLFNILDDLARLVKTRAKSIENSSDYITSKHGTTAANSFIFKQNTTLVALFKTCFSKSYQQLIALR